MTGSLTGFYWATDWIDADTLVNDPANDIGMLARQSDMYAGIDWQRPDNNADQVNDNAEIVKGTNGYSAGYGGQSLTWPLRGLRRNMVGFIVTQKFPGGVYTYPATVAVPNTRVSDVPHYYQVLATRTEYSAAELALGGLDRWVINFDDATEIATPAAAGLIEDESGFGLLLEDGSFMGKE